MFSMIVWQRFCEPARLRIAYCPSVFRAPCSVLRVPCLVGHLILLWMHRSSCPIIYSLEVCSSFANRHIFLLTCPPEILGGVQKSNTVHIETVLISRLLMLRSCEVTASTCLLGCKVFNYLMKAMNSVLLIGM